MSSVLVVFSDFEKLPTFFVFPKTSKHHKTALNADGVIVNLEENCKAKTLEFVILLSQIAYTKEGDLAEYIVENPSGSFDKIINCGFAP
jgi:hypothetical protein